MLIVRAWPEPTTPQGLRARISTTVDLARMPVASIPVADPGQVLAAVAAWLDGFVAAGSSGDARNPDWTTSVRLRFGARTRSVGLGAEDHETTPPRRI